MSPQYSYLNHTRVANLSLIRIDWLTRPLPIICSETESSVTCPPSDQRLKFAVAKQSTDFPQ
jgi:hypothetical protein